MILWSGKRKPSFLSSCRVPKTYQGRHYFFNFEHSSSNQLVFMPVRKWEYLLWISFIWVYYAKITIRLQISVRTRSIYIVEHYKYKIVGMWNKEDGRDHCKDGWRHKTLCYINAVKLILKEVISEKICVKTIDVDNVESAPLILILILIDVWESFEITALNYNLH